MKFRGRALEIPAKLGVSEKIGFQICVLMHFLKAPKALIPCKSGVLAESSFLCYTNKTMNLHRNSERESKANGKQVLSSIYPGL